MSGMISGMYGSKQWPGRSVSRDRYYIFAVNHAGERVGKPLVEESRERANVSALMLIGRASIGSAEIVDRTADDRVIETIMPGAS